MNSIVFMGTPDFAVPSLQGLIDAGYDIPMVITQPDKKGNRNKIIPSPVKILALNNNIRVEQPYRLRKDEDIINELREISPDLIVVAAFGQILPKSVLEIPAFGCINVHGSILPALRGAAPMQMAVLNGLKETGVTIMKMEEGLDTGDMISKVSVNIEGMNIEDVSKALSIEGAKLLVDTLPSIIDGTAHYEKQNDELSTYAHMIKKEDGYTDFNEPADYIERKIRAYHEWPTLYSKIEDLQIKFFKAEALMNEIADGDPGTVSSIDKNSYTINCNPGQLRILEQQLTGKKRMSAGDFLRGHALKVGQKIG